MALPNHGSSNSGFDDPLLSILRLERENFLQKHANLTIVERTQLWNERSKQLTAVLDLETSPSSSMGVTCDVTVCSILSIMSMLAKIGSEEL